MVHAGLLVFYGVLRFPGSPGVVSGGLWWSAVFCGFQAYARKPWLSTETFEVIEHKAEVKNNSVPVQY